LSLYYALMIIKEIADEINDHLVLYGKNAIDVDYDSLGVFPFCNSRLDEY
jgi:electron transfer flavoprotein alpha/beta subunit